MTPLPIANASVASRPGLIQHSTDSHRESDKLAFWASLVGQHLVSVECQSVATPECFHGAMALRQVGRIGLAQMAAGGLRVSRTPGLISRANDEYFLVSIQESGRSDLEQDGRLAQLDPGDITVVSSGKPFQLSVSGDFVRTVLTFPADELRHLLPDIDSMTATTLDGQGAAVRLFGQVAHHYFETDTNSMPTEAMDHAASGLVEILAGTLASQSATVPAKKPKLARFHLTRIKHHAMQELHSPALSVASVSRALQISPAHIHRLFAGEAQTFSAWLWSSRLLACKKELEDPAQSHRRISEIAFGTGFNNCAHFSRSFRAKFGMSPRECRSLELAKAQKPAIRPPK